MRLPLKHIATVFLLLLMAAPLFYVQTMEWRRGRIRREMKENLKQELLTSITLSPSDVHWYKPGKEIMVGDHLFDIEAQEILPNGNIRFTGLFDTKETILHAQLNKQQRQEQQKDSRQLSSFFNDWQGLPVIEEETIEFTASSKLEFIHPEMETVSAYSTILKPPPQA